MYPVLRFIGLKTTLIIVDNMLVATQQYLNLYHFDSGSHKGPFKDQLSSAHIITTLHQQWNTQVVLRLLTILRSIAVTEIATSI